MDPNPPLPIGPMYVPKGEECFFPPAVQLPSRQKSSCRAKVASQASGLQMKSKHTHPVPCSCSTLEQIKKLTAKALT
eukprot:1146684-Pelagomonas_calceolata.AAC.1